MKEAINAWIWVFVMVGVVMIVWWVSQPTVQTLIDETRTVVRSTGFNTTGYEQGITTVELVNVVWAPIIILALLLFGYLVSTKREGISYYE